MTSQETRSVAIIGAGPYGLAAAAYLRAPDEAREDETALTTQ